MHRTIRLLFGLALAWAFVASAQPEGTVIAEDLTGPMGLAVDAEGNVFVIESGVGGDQEMNVTNSQGQQVVGTFGASARVLKIAPDGTQEVVAQLPSVNTGLEAEGGSRLAFLEGRLYATSGIWKGDWGDGRPDLMGHVVAIDGGQAVSVADTYAFEAAHNPDPNILDSHPYGLAAAPDGSLWIADAGANAVLRADPATGEVSLIALMDGIASPLPNPSRGGAMEADPVPTGITFDADGNALVALLPGFPFVPGSSKVVRITPAGDVSDVATDLTMTTDLQHGPDGLLYAVQIGVFTEAGPTPESGRIVRLDESGATELVSGLSFPTAIAFAGNGDAFVTLNGAGGPGGAVVRFDGLATAP